MILKIKNLDSSNLLNIDLFEMRDREIIPDVHMHRSDAYFDLIIKNVKYFSVSEAMQSISYTLYPYNVNRSPFTLRLPYGEEMEILKEV